MLNHSVFKEKANKPAEDRIKDHEVEILDKKLGQILNILDTVYITPYYAKSEQVKFFISNHLKKLFRNKKSLIDNIALTKTGLSDLKEILNS